MGCSPTSRPHPGASVALTRTVLALAGALLALPAAAVLAQGLPGRAAVRGRVLDAETRRPVAFALVDIIDQQRRVETGEDGGFELAGLQPQLVTVRMRAVGYQVVERSLNLFAGRTVAVEYLLKKPVAYGAPGSAGAVRLADIRVDASSPTARMLAAFEERRRLGIGKFYTSEEIAARSYASVPEVIRDAPGIRFVRGASGAEMIASTRQGMPIGWGARYTDCFLQVIVDGMLIWSPEPPSRPGAITFDPPDLSSIISTQELAGIEVYPGVAGIPPMYRRHGSTCGAILFWTKRGGYTPTIR